MLAAVVTVGALAFWWQAVGSTAVSDSLAGRALITRFHGDATSTFRLLEGAVNVSGKNYMPRYILAFLWEFAASQADTPKDRTQYLLNALDVIHPVVIRDPMNRLARFREASVMSRLAGINPDRYASDMLRELEVILRLMPGQWDTSLFAGHTFVDHGRAARGLEVARMMRAKGAGEHEPRLVDYLEAKALLRLNRPDEAQPLIARFAASNAKDTLAILEELAAIMPE